MNIFLLEIKSNRKNLIIWCLAIIFFLFAGMQKYHALIADGNGEGLKEIMNALPDFMKTIFGLSLIDISSPIGYYAVLTLYTVILISIYSSMLGVNIIYKEERDCTAEFLMTRPTSLNKILTAKIMAAFTNIVILNIVILISTLILVLPVSGGSGLIHIIECSFGMFMISVIALSFGVMAAAVPRFPVKSSISVLVAIMTSFILYIVVELFDNFNFLRFLTPFKYFDAKEIVTKGLNPGYLLLSIFISSAFLFIAYKSYNKRDLDI